MKRWERRIDYFGAGPAALPQPVLQALGEPLLRFADTGVSILELSHRDAAFEAVIEAAKQRLRELLSIPPNYDILFLQGGASQQFAMVPMNFLQPGRPGGYVLTGYWSEKALAEAERVGAAYVAASTRDEAYKRIPAPADIGVQPGSAYVHLTSNNTIVGSQWRVFPNLDVPIVADMSSDILSRPFDVSNFHLIYAGAQKNLGPAGVTLVILRRDWLDTVEPPDQLPHIFRYRVHAQNNSLYNTPPVFAILAVKLVLDWVASEGGVSAMAERNRRKAELVYQMLDDSDGFYHGVVEPESRSLMNVTFRLSSPELEKQFITEAEAHGFLGIKGHRSVGGCRVSLYNAVPVEAVERLVAFMDEFRRRH